MSGREEFAAALRAMAAGVSVRRLAERVGWSRSTVQDWLRGTRLPSAEQLHDLTDAIGVTSMQVRERLIQLRAAAAAPTDTVADAVDTPTQDGNSTTDNSADEDSTDGNGNGNGNGNDYSPPEAAQGTEIRRRKRRRWQIIAWIAVAASLVIAGFFLGRFTSPNRSSPDRQAAVEARVANTEGLGVYSYQGPSNKTAKLNSYNDGDVVGVVCVLVADPISDETMKMTRSVWALLAGGGWVPDLYLDLDKSWVPPQPPPAPLQYC